MLPQILVALGGSACVAELVAVAVAEVETDEAVA